MPNILEKIKLSGFSVFLHGFSAIDFYLGGKNSGYRDPLVREPKVRHILTDADTGDLAKLFEDLRFPGMILADAFLDAEGKTFYFSCASSDTNRPFMEKGHLAAETAGFPFDKHRPSFKLLEFYQDCVTSVFYDPRGNYPLLKDIRRSVPSPQIILEQGLNPDAVRCAALMDAALILSKYFPVDDKNAYMLIKTSARLFEGLKKGSPVSPEDQRLLLCSLMTSANPAPGLELLKACGFIDEYWQELAVLDEAEHNKDYHPEGNAWKHTLETFRYRKSGSSDLLLSLGLLLHDTGKPISVSAGSRRFDGHAELGETQARRFLERLGFGAEFIKDVCFLVKNHMLAAALPRLPLFRTKEIMASQLFPVLLELYRCDESSSFKGLDGYYESSAAYQSFLRNRRNPYRTPEGRKLNYVRK